MCREKALYPVVCIWAILLVAYWSEPGFARQNILTGNVTAGYTFVDRTYDNSEVQNNNDAGDRREYSIGPDFNLQSLGIHSSLLFHYRPEVTYEKLDSTTDIDHYLDLNWQHQATRQWSYQITDSYVLSNDPRQAADFFDTGGQPAPIDQLDTGENVTQNLGTRRYWTNSLRFLTIYTYAPESEYQIGANYNVLRDDTSGDEASGFQEYDRYGGLLMWSHRYTPTWKSKVGLNYSKGDFAEQTADAASNDLQQYRVDLGVDYNRTVNNFFPVEYSYLRVDYDDTRDDIWGHELTFGWDYTIDARNHVIVGAGPSYVESESLDGDLRYNLLFNYIRAYQHGTLDVLLEKRLLSRHFSGIGDSGFTDTTDFSVTGSYQVTRDIVVDAFAQYSHEEILNPGGDYFNAALGGGNPTVVDQIGDVTYTRDSYSTGATVSYNVWRWLTASLGYSYTNRDGDVSTDAYDEHRILFQLTATKELWRQ